MEGEAEESEDFEPDPDADDDQYPEAGDIGPDEEEDNSVVPLGEEEDNG
jgi:hypothetical protein